MTQSISILHARHFALTAVGLINPFPDVASALNHHGFIQMDPLNVCGRMHDLILRNRITGYREGDLLRHLYAAGSSTNRNAFEHYLPGQGILVTFPIGAWPLLVRHMADRRRGQQGYARELTVGEEKIARRILAELAARGPLTTDDIEHEGRAHSAWGSRGRAVKMILEKLFAHGRVLITERRQFRRVYDLPERVLPAAVINARSVSLEEDQRWLILQKLKQRRLVTLRKADLSLVDALVERIAVDDCPLLYCLRSDLSLLDKIGDLPAATAEPRLLAPLDPLIYDRKLTSRLWSFDYTWEVYTPAAKRVRGYYALPVLSGNQLVGHVDPKADRAVKRLRVMKRSMRRGHSVVPAVRALAGFLGLRT